MAYVCEKPKGSCKNCEHYKFDLDYGEKVCYAAIDKKSDDADETIYTHDEAALLVDMFENLLERYNIRIPSPEDDERDANDIGLYGSTYSDLLDAVEDHLISVLDRVPFSATVYGEFSGRV